MSHIKSCAAQIDHCEYAEVKWLLLLIDIIWLSFADLKKYALTNSISLIRCSEKKNLNSTSYIYLSWFPGFLVQCDCTVMIS